MFESTYNDAQKKRAAIIKDFFAGKPVKSGKNAKGLYELYSPDGISLYHYDYYLLKKSDAKVNGKNVIYQNVYTHIPHNEHGLPMTQKIAMIRNILDRELDRDAWTRVYVSSGKDTMELDLTGYIEEYTNTIYSMLREKYTEYPIDRYFKKWDGCFFFHFKVAIKLLQSSGKKIHVASEYKNLKDINDNVKGSWAIINAVMKYWIANGLSYKEEDDDYIEKAPKILQAAYAALDGEVGPLKAEDKKPGIVVLRLMMPSMTLKQLPLYMYYDNPTVQEIVRQRLVKGK